METTYQLHATCPECRGPLSEITKEAQGRKICEFKCLVGHTFSPKTLLEAHSEAQESILWSAVVALEESANLVDAVISEFTPEVGSKLRDQAIVKQRQAQEIRKILERLEPFQLGPVD